MVDLLALMLLTAHAQEPPSTPETSWSQSITEDFELRYWRIADHVEGFEDRDVLNYGEQVNRLTALFGKGPTSLWLQVDEVALFANRYFLDEELYVERDLLSGSLQSPLPTDSFANIEKIRLAYEKPEVSVTLGDTYAAFGRGIALNLNRNVDIDVDSSIQGVKVVGHPGSTWDITGVVGWLNRQQVFQDNPNLALSGDKKHGVVGARVDRYGFGPANIGIHGVAWDFVDTEGWGGLSELGSVDAVVGGATVELPGVLGLDTYLEGDLVSYPTTVLFGGGESAPGVAIYGSTVAYVGKTTWLLEGKRYRDSERLNTVVGSELYKVAVAPTLEYERVMTEDSAAAASSNDIYGAKLRVDWALVPVRFVPYASIAAYRDLDLGGLHFNDVPETIIHPVVGVEAVGDHVSVLANGGMRVDDRDGTEGGADRQIHGDLDVKLPIAGEFHGDVAVGAEAFHWGKNTFQQADYVELETAYALQKGSDIAIIAYVDYTTNPLVDSVGNLTESVYGAFELQVKPTSALTMKAFYGAYKAGIRCSGGQCRLLPGFDGARVSVTGMW